MANPQHHDILSQGVAEWNRWRRRHPEVVPDLSCSINEASEFEHDIQTLVGVVLHQVVPGRAPTAQDGLRGADLDQVNFRNARLSRAFLDGAMLIEADLRGCVLNDAHMTGCVLTGAKMKKANLTRADLTAATLRWADLTGADLTGAVLRQANLNEVTAKGAVLREADLGYANLVGACLSGADLSHAHVYGTSSWDVSLEETRQEHLIITRPSEPEVSVDDLKVAQFLHLMITNANIRDVIDTVTTKVVLVLGRFTPARKPVLNAVHDELRRRGLIPVLFDFERPHNRDFTETVTTLARLSRFIVADLTDPSSLPKELEAIVPTVAVPLLPLLQDGNEPYAMFSDYWKYPWVLEIVRYTDVQELRKHFDSRVMGPVDRAGTSPTVARGNAGSEPVLQGSGPQGKLPKGVGRSMPSISPFSKSSRRLLVTTTRYWWNHVCTK